MRAIPLWKLNRIMLDLDGTVMQLFGPPRDLDKSKHGSAHYGQADLTYEEAEQLICSLRLALDACKEMDQLAEQDLAPKE